MEETTLINHFAVENICDSICDIRFINMKCH